MRTALLAATVVLLAPVRLAAQQPVAATHFERARVCSAALDYACAEDELVQARKNVDEADAATRAAVLRLSAETALATGRRADADAHLAALLEAQPAFQPAPGAWPAGWLAELEKVRAAGPDRLAPVLEFEGPAEGRDREALDIRVRASDRSGVGAVVLYVAGPTPLRLPMSTDDGRTWSATVPADRVAKPEVAFRVEAFDLQGNGPSRLGSDGEPRRIPIHVPPLAIEKPLVQQWWFWTVLGAAAVGTGVGIYYLTKLGHGSDEPGVPGPGRLNVEVRWPSPSD